MGQIQCVFLCILLFILLIQIQRYDIIVLPRQDRADLANTWGTIEFTGIGNHSLSPLGGVLRIDYCDARPFYRALLKTGYINFDSKYTKLYYISLNSQMKKLSALMSYITIDKEVSKRGDEEHEN